MQKIFVRRFLIIMLITVGLTLLGNFALQTVFSQRKAEQSAAEMRADIAERIESNQKVIDELTINLDDNYITRAWALAEIIAQDPTIIYSFDEMDRLAGVLNVEEVHVTDELGILRWGNVRDYYGLDFSATDQTRPFLPGLTDKSFALAQEPQLNGSIGKLFQYISVARQDKPGIVQVGVSPDILDNALKNNKIDVVINNFNVENGVNVTAFDKATGIVSGDTHGAALGKAYGALGIDEDYFTNLKTSGWIRQDDGTRLFCVFGTVGDYLIETSFTEARLFSERKNQNIAAAASSILLGFAIVVAVFIFLKRIIIHDIEIVDRDLKSITAGDLNVTVAVHSTPEFISLSDGINEMVRSLSRQMEEISRQAADLEESSRNILSSLKYAKRIQNNLLPPARVFRDAFRDSCVLWEPRDLVGGDIYWMKKFEGGTVLCACDCTGHGTPGALLTMLVVSALDTIVTKGNCEDTAGVLWELEQRLVSTLNAADDERTDASDIKDGADLCILFIRENGEIIFSSAKLHIFICDGQSVQKIRGQKLSLGDGSLKSRTQIKTTTLPAGENNTYYIASDGLFEQVGGKNRVPFGYSRFSQIILAENNRTQAEITQDVWQAFQCYMGTEKRRDDVMLISFKL